MRTFGFRPQTEQMDTENGIERLREALRETDSIVVGGAAGLSTSAGFVYAGERFRRYFGDFAERYGFRDMYSGGFYPYSSPEETWAFWSRNIYINRYMDPPRPVYRRLYELVDGREASENHGGDSLRPEALPAPKKDYFVITTNVDHCFQRAGFDKKRLFYTQGDYGLWQCSEPCHEETYDNEQIVREMVRAQGFAFAQDGSLVPPMRGGAGKGACAGGAADMAGETDFTRLKMTVPSELIPRCPVCGKPMSMNLRADDTFVENDGWHEAAERYREFLRRHRSGRILFLELGCGMNTPGIFKYPFWQMTAEREDAVYVCINKGEAFAPDEIKNKSICINGDIGDVLDRLKSAE